MSIKLSYLALLMAVYFPLVNARGIEFNTHLLDTENRNNVDLSAYSREGYVAPGEYIVDIILNGQVIKDQQVVKFNHDLSENSSYACLTQPIIDLLALKDSVKSSLLFYPGTQCFRLAIPDSSVVYEPENQTLSVTVPQADLQYQDEDWSPPAQWDNGVNGFIFDYNMLASRYMPDKGNASDNYSLYGTSGLNFGAWRIRSDYQYNTTRGRDYNQSSLDLPQTYIFRPVPSLRSRLVMGQTYLSSDIFDTFRFTGVSLTSDERMLPPSLRGYAPQITGIAQTHAQVTVSQNGRILWQSQVPAGPFVVPGLSETVRGNLDVTIREDNGQIHTWQVNTASVPFLARKDNVRFKTAIGKPLTYAGSGHTVEPLFSTGEITWGAFNNTSLYGGFIASDGHYRALALGVGENMGVLGAASFDVTQSVAQVNNQPERTGYSYRFNYAKTFDKTGSTIAFAGYRFSEKSFMSMSQYIDRANGYGSSLTEKQSYMLSFNQSISSLGLNVLFSMSRQNYWDASANENYTASLNKIFDIGMFQGATASLSLGRNRTLLNEQDNQIYLSLTLPWGVQRQVSYSMQHDSNGRMNQAATLYNRSSDKTSWSLGVGQQREEGQQNGTLLNGNIQTTTPYGQGNANLSMLSQEYKNLGLSWYGSFTATRYGATFHQNMAENDPRLMIDTGDVAGVPVDNDNGVTNSFGIAVVPVGSSYERSDIAVDVTALPVDISVSSNVISKVLTEGAIGYKKIATTKGGQLIGTIRLADGSFPPLGTQVKSQNGKVLGIIGDQGFTYLSGISIGDRKDVDAVWAQGHCRLQLPEVSDLTSGVLLLPCH
ncbi:TPA_asm: fimbria/pilus outer membrane usher protein [Salmonella enterica subsp. houtenae serovar 45:g,z51:-]|uniref:Fimbria/pilus outer membrane usher protein n=1 Tax=Salmonella enterica subsp. houtenae serovar 45:g,z51:- TaxID=1967611 RepID=A0A736RCY9_SALHO|nr:fimbrial biogenesis outer membrane usher protein [Salmonella enterica subsp. houtenae str. CFSAN000557]HAE7767575.1 fimbria/pilus outer membrane usher protein [Salmonella enterica subsp. houtenae serovar 45:g,z51:-]